MFQKLMFIATAGIVAGCAAVPYHSKQADYSPMVGFNPTPAEGWDSQLASTEYDHHTPVGPWMRVYTKVATNTVVIASYFPNRIAEPELMAVHEAGLFRKDGYLISDVEKVSPFNWSTDQAARFYFRDPKNDPPATSYVLFVRPRGENRGLIRYDVAADPKSDPLKLLLQ